MRKDTEFRKEMIYIGISIIFALVLLLSQVKYIFGQQELTYPIVDTHQEIFYDTIIEISAPAPGEVFYGQDANYTGNMPSYQDNGDGTISDLITGLMWSKSPDMDGDGDIDYDDKMSYTEAMGGASSFNLGGFDDWRLPSIKEMYSLIIFSGKDPSGYNGTNTDELVPFIDTNYFDFAYGDLNAGERIIDAQMASSNIYVGLTMGGDETMFGVNFADGRIKGYPTGPMVTAPRVMWSGYIILYGSCGILNQLDWVSSIILLIHCSFIPILPGTT